MNRLLVRGFIGSVLVAVGGLLISTIPTSAHLMDVEVLGVLRGSEAGRMAGLVVVLLGLGILAAQWLTLCRQLASHPDDDALPLVRHTALVWSAPLVLAPPLFSRDGWSYAAQGMLTHLSLSPYEHGPGVLHGPIVEAVDPRWLDTATPYGPVPLIFGDLVAGETGNPWVLVVAHRALALLGLVMLAWAVPRLARWTGVSPALASALVLLSPLMIAHGVGGLHNDLLMVGLMAVALVVGVERSWVLGCVIGATAAAVKLPGGLVCVVIALAALPAGARLVERLRRMAGAGLVSLLTLLALGVPAGLGIGWVEGLTVPGTVVTPMSVTPMLGGALDWTLGLVLDLAPATFLDLARQAGTLASLGVVAWVALRRPTGDRVQALRALALVTGSCVLLGPVVHWWYLLWVVPFVAVLRLSRVGTVGLVGVSTLAGLVAPLDSSLHGAYLAIVLGAMTVAALTPVLLLTRRARGRIESIAATTWPYPSTEEAVVATGHPVAPSPASGDDPQPAAAELGVHVEHPRHGA